MLINWRKLRKDNINETDLLTQSIWFNENLKRGNKTLFLSQWCEAGVFFINDLLDENKEFYTLDQFYHRYDLSSDFFYLSSGS